MGTFDRSRISLGRRTQQQTDTRESNSGTSRQGFMNYSTCSLKFFKLGEPGKYHDLNILPWRVATRNHPEVVAGNMQVGDFDYVLDVWVHRSVGPNQVDCICPKKTMGRACPICDEGNRLWDDGEKDAARPFFASRKCVYLVQELDERLHADGDVKVFETSHATFSRDLQDEATNCLRGNGVVNFASPDSDGRVVSFRVGEDKMGNGKKFKKAVGFSFQQRAEEIPDEVLENLPSLDAMMVVKSAEELKAMMYGDDAATNDFDDARERAAREGEREPARNEYRQDPRDERRLTRSDLDAMGFDGYKSENGRQEPVNTRRGSMPFDDDDDQSIIERPERCADPVPQGRTFRDTRGQVHEDPFPDQPTEMDTSPMRPTPAQEPEQAQDDRCPRGYCFGRDCNKKPMCARCPDDVFNECQRCSRGR